MKIVYASRMGKVEKLVNALSEDAFKIENGNQTINEDYVLFTYTDGNGIVPPVVEEFLKENHSYLKGVIASGSMERHANTYCFAGDIIAKQYNVPCIYKVDGSGTEEDLVTIKRKLNELN